METKTVESVIIRLNNGNELEVKQSKFRKALYELHSDFKRNVIPKVRKMERMQNK